MSNVCAEVLLMKMSDRGRLCDQQKHAQRQDNSAPKNANIALALLKHWFQTTARLYRNQVTDASYLAAC
jgi:hypothetical protein